MPGNPGANLPSVPFLNSFFTSLSSRFHEIPNGGLDMM